MFRLASPWWLLALIPIWIWAIAAWRSRNRRYANIELPSIGALKMPHSWIEHCSNLWPWVRAIILSGLVVALARPQSGSSIETIKSEGIDIVIALDNSPSMRAEDFQPQNRLAVAKEIVRDFVSERQGDRIGLIVFSGIAATRCPRTLDHDLLDQILESLDFASSDQSGTAIGMGLGSALNLLRGASGESKVVVLVTDGRSNAGELNPRSAAQIAETLGVKVYTIGVGKEGEVPFPITGPFGTRRHMMRLDLDEPLLKEIAQKTGGQYFRATDSESLQKIFEQIDTLEKVEVESEVRALYTEQFFWILIPIIGLALLERLLWDTRLRRVP